MNKITKTIPDINISDKAAIERLKRYASWLASNPGISEGASGLARVGLSVAARAQRQADHETILAVWQLTERIQEHLRDTNIIDGPGRFHKDISQLAPALKRRRWDNQADIQRRAA